MWAKRNRRILGVQEDAHCGERGELTSHEEMAVDTRAMLISVPKGRVNERLIEESVAE